MSLHLIIGAMDEEVSALVNKMTDVLQGDVKGVQYFKGLLGGESVVVARSGVGKVNAAYSTTVLIDKFSPKQIINIGSAGGLQEGQKVGDIVVANKLQYHDLDIGPNTHNDERFIFFTNNSTIEDTLNTLGLTYHLGLIVSGDQFITKVSPSFANIQKTFPQAIAVEMEASAIAHVASKAGVEIIVLRALSDVTHEDDNHLVFEEYLALASENSATICEAYLKSL